MDTPIAGWFVLENPIEMNELGVPLFFRKPPYDTWKNAEYLVFEWEIDGLNQGLLGLPTRNQR